MTNRSTILRSYDCMVKDRKPVYLMTGFLMRRAKAVSAIDSATDSALAFAIRVGIQVPLYEIDERFWFDGYFEGGYLYDDTITLMPDPVKGLPALVMAWSPGKARAWQRQEMMRCQWIRRRVLKNTWYLRGSGRGQQTRQDRVFVVNYKLL